MQDSSHDIRLQEMHGVLYVMPVLSCLPLEPLASMVMGLVGSVCFWSSMQLTSLSHASLSKVQFTFDHGNTDTSGAQIIASLPPKLLSRLRQGYKCRSGFIFPASYSLGP